jgi:hypothetical protein
MLHSSNESGMLCRALDAQCPLHGVPSSADSNVVQSSVRVDDCIVPIPFELTGGEEYYCSATASFNHLPYLSYSRDVSFSFELDFSFLVTDLLCIYVAALYYVRSQNWG